MSPNGDEPTADIVPRSRGRIRVLALALIVRDGRLLVTEGYDSVKSETFYRLLGGELEFRETGAEALTRELREELGADVEPPVYHSTLENIYSDEGAPGHEIELVYDVTLRSPLLDDRLAWDATVECGLVLRVVSAPLTDLRGSSTCAAAPLYPHGALSLLDD